MAAQAKKKTAKPSEHKKSRTSNAKKKQPSTQQRTGRGTAAAIIILLVLSVLLLIGFFASNAAVLGPICDGIKYLLGAGFYVLRRFGCVFFLMITDPKKSSLDKTWKTGIIKMGVI